MKMRSFFNKGPTHVGDLIYLVNNTEYYSTLKPEDEEYKLSKIMTSMWTNFAIHGYAPSIRQYTVRKVI